MSNPTNTAMFVQVRVPVVDDDKMELITRTGESLAGRIDILGNIIQGEFADSQQGKDQLRDWLAIVAATQAGNIIDVCWGRITKGTL